MDLGWNDLPYPLLLIDEQERIVAANACAAQELGRPAHTLVRLAMGDLMERGKPGGEVRLRGFSGPAWLHIRPCPTHGRAYQMLTWTPLPGPATREKPAEVRDPKAATILVAEDEASIRDICRRVLGDAGYKVMVAPDGQAAIDMLSQMGGGVDLVLADVVMPTAGGDAILEYIRRAELRVPVVFTTGYALSNAPFLDEPGIRLLRKPFTLAQLLATVRGALTSEPQSQ